ncbi:hypothetical protein BH11PSE2_BH11PSE2_13920 [soil metagenome]
MALVMLWLVYAVPIVVAPLVALFRRRGWRWAFWIMGLNAFFFASCLAGIVLVNHGVDVRVGGIEDTLINIWFGLALTSGPAITVLAVLVMSYRTWRRNAGIPPYARR